MTSTKTSSVTPAPSKRLGIKLSTFDPLIDLIQFGAAVAAYFISWDPASGLLSIKPGEFTALGWSAVLIALSIWLTTFESDKLALRVSETLVGILYICLTMANWGAPLRTLLLLVLLVMNGYQIFWMPIMNWLYKIKTPNHP